MRKVLKIAPAHKNSGQVYSVFVEIFVKVCPNFSSSFFWSQLCLFLAQISCQSWFQFLAQNSFRREQLKRGLLLTRHFLVEGHCPKFTRPEKQSNNLTTS